MPALWQTDGMCLIFPSLTPASCQEPGQGQETRLWGSGEQPYTCMLASLPTPLRKSWLPAEEITATV